jgi:nitroreductase
MKKLIFGAMSLVFVCSLLAYGQTNSNKTIDSILSSYSPRNFTTEPVSDNDIKQIIQCGIKAPSARNGQPWKFTIVKNPALCNSVISNMTQGNVVIVISGPESEQQALSVNFDCALATQNMFLAAEALGLGARIYTGPISTVNNTLKKSLGIPDGFRAVAVLRVGHLDPAVDAKTAASPRKDAAETVNNAPEK